MRNLMLQALVIATLALAGGCGGDTDCKGACDLLSSCGLKSSGLSCDSSCDQGDCAACINDKSCGEIAGGQCAGECPGVSFTKK